MTRFVVAVLLALALARVAVAQTADDFVGVWRDAATGRPLVIERLDPDQYADHMKARSLSRHATDPVLWGGYAAAATADRPAGVHLLGSPRVADMNPDLPDWVKQQIAGQLHWRLDLKFDSDDLFDLKLKGKFYPGLVEWTEGADGGPGEAKVAGQGDPVDVSYTPDGDLPLEATQAPVIQLVYPGHSPVSGEIKYMRKGDSFKVYAILPQDVARKAGEKLTVTVTGLSGGSSTSLELETTSPELKGFAARYTHPDQVLIANFGKVPNREPLFGLFPPASGFGPRLSLNVKNGEEVELAAAGATYRFRVFDNAIELALARRLDGIQDLAFIWTAKLASSAAPEVKDDATRRLMMTRTALEIGADARLAAEVRLAGVNTYLASDGETGLLLRQDLDWIPGSDADFGTPNRFGTIWAAYQEAIDVNGPQTGGQMTYYRTHAAYSPYTSTESLEIAGSLQRAERDYKKKVTEAFLGLYGDSVFAIYNIYVEQTAGEQLMKFWFGIDRMGQPVSVSDQVFALADIGVQLALPSAIEGVTGQGPIRRTVGQARSGPPLSVPLETVNPGSSLPDSMKPASGAPQVSHAAPPPGPPPPLPGPPAPLPKLPPNPSLPIKRVDTGSPKISKLGSLSPVECRLPPPSQARTSVNAAAAFPSDVAGLKDPNVNGIRVLDFDQTYAQQIENDSCTAAAIERAFAEKAAKGDAGYVVGQRDIIPHVLTQRGKPFNSVTAGARELTEGIDYDEASSFLTDAGITNHTEKFDLSLGRKIREYQENGFEVVVHVRYPAGNHHSVHIEKIIYDEAGNMKAFRFFDPGPGDIRELSRKTFSDYIQAAAAANQKRGKYVLAFKVPPP